MGESVSQDVEISEGVTFHFDNPFEEDLQERYVVASLLVNKSKYNDFESNPYELQDIDELDEIDSKIDAALREGGFKDVSPAEYDKTNSNDLDVVFQYTLILN